MFFCPTCINSHPISAKMCAQKLPLELSKVYAISPEVNQPTHPYEYRHGQIIATRSELRPLDYVPHVFLFLAPCGESQQALSIHFFSPRAADDPSPHLVPSPCLY
ncbi:hypothetical protein Pst134EA_011898 [Puccinia striiformis f. sp. tritici]|uniref:hypothetical protein n=1 Tax=Puccinia striiformis f. sp. tritici TaxID=168172 RepID=UPI00200872B7|nr:hypothetical protein Pst134EA_011898 [Puccinia striiformis f. sp. tritici]KAH9468273.1 hypothetical protein Pst134EA_011898 [Puccinia striiformis f. sp. tritici]